MVGRIKQRQALARTIDRPSSDSACLVCALCDRPIPLSQRDAHHLVPKSRGGVQTVWMHRICHRQIHALLTETELERTFHHIEALRQHPPLARFIAWVKRRPDGFFERTRKSERLKHR